MHTRPDRAKGEGDHIWPELLPGGRAVLFTIHSDRAGDLDDAQVAVLDLQSGTRKVLVRAAPMPTTCRAVISSTRAAATLRAVAFDLVGLETRGTPVPIISDVATTINGGVSAVVAEDGTWLMCLRGGRCGMVRRTLMWVDRDGRGDADSGTAACICLSPPVSRRCPFGGVCQRSGERHLDLGRGSHDADPRHVRPWERQLPGAGRPTAVV